MNKLSVRTVMIAAALAALAAGLAAILLTSGVRPAAAESSVRTPISSVSPEQIAAIPALRGQAASPQSMPDAALRFATSVRASSQYAPNPALARAIRVPGQGEAPWTVIPGNDSVCLTSGDNGGGTCASLADAAAGKLYIQLISPPDAKHAMPPSGQPVKSTIVGVVPAGATSATAVTAGGVRVDGDLVPGGLYSVTATNITSVSFDSGEADLRVQ